MTAALPTDNAIDKAVKDFGIGTYDASADGSGEHGEDSEERPPRNLPDGGGPDVFSPDRLLSYPEEPDARLGSWWKNVFAAAGVPGDTDRTVTHAHPDMSTLDDRVTSVSQDGPDEDDEAKTGLSELPSDSGNPSARSDYYDRTVTGATGDVWPKEDSGAYVSQEECVADAALPGVMKNEESMDNGLQSLGNWQSGYEVEDVSGRQGFPATDFAENVDYDRSDLQGGGRVLASRSDGMNRKATNISLVNDLTSEFLKEFGKKDLTKRHVLAFLQKKGEPQFLSSDVIRCLKLSHEIYVKDVLDEFLVVRNASTRLASRKTVASGRILVVDFKGKVAYPYSDDPAADKKVAELFGGLDETNGEYYGSLFGGRIPSASDLLDQEAEGDVMAFSEESGDGTALCFSSADRSSFSVPWPPVDEDWLGNGDPLVFYSGSVGDGEPVKGVDTGSTDDPHYAEWLKEHGGSGQGQGQQASRTTIASVREKLIQLEIDHITDPEISSVFRRCAANLARAMAEMERVENRNG